MDIDFCRELRKLEGEEAAGGCPNPLSGNTMVELMRQLELEPPWQVALKQGMVLLLYQAMAQGGNNRKLKPRKQGVCRFYRLGLCNPLNNGGGGCRREGRLNKSCFLFGYFKKREDSTISSKLTAEGLRLVFGYKLRQMNG